MLETIREYGALAARLIGDAGQANKFVVWRASTNEVWHKLEVVVA